MVLGMAHAVAFTWRGTKQNMTEALHNPELKKQTAGMKRGAASHGVGVAQAAVLSLVQDVEASALVVGTV